MTKFKKQPKNNYYFFMMERKKELEAQGYRFPRGMKDVASAVAGEWQALPQAEKDRYSEMARKVKEDEKTNFDNKFTCSGESYASLNRRTAAEQAEEAALREMFNQIVKCNMPTERIYVVMHAIPSCEVGLDNLNESKEYYPLEIAMSSFSLQDGLICSYWSLINTMSVPCGYASTAKDTNEETALPIPGSPIFHQVAPRAVQYDDIMDNIRVFVETWCGGYPENKYMVFVMDKNTKSLKGSLEWLVKNAHKNKRENERLISKLKFYSFPKLVIEFAVQASTLNPEYKSEMSQFRVPALAETFLNQGFYDYKDEITCNYHRKDEYSHKMNVCCKNVILRRIFLVFEEVCSWLNCELTGRHKVLEYHKTQLAQHLKERLEKQPAPSGPSVSSAAKPGCSSPERAPASDSNSHGNAASSTHKNKFSNKEASCNNVSQGSQRSHRYDPERHEPTDARNNSSGSDRHSSGSYRSPKNAEKAERGSVTPRQTSSDSHHDVYKHRNQLGQSDSHRNRSERESRRANTSKCDNYKSRIKKESQEQEDGEIVDDYCVDAYDRYCAGVKDRPQTSRNESEHAHSGGSRSSKKYSDWSVEEPRSSYDDYRNDFSRKRTDVKPETADQKFNIDDSWEDSRHHNGMNARRPDDVERNSNKHYEVVRLSNDKDGSSERDHEEQYNESRSLVDNPYTRRVVKTERRSSEKDKYHEKDDFSSQRSCGNGYENNSNYEGRSSHSYSSVEMKYDRRMSGDSSRDNHKNIDASPRNRSGRSDEHYFNYREDYRDQQSRRRDCAGSRVVFDDDADRYARTGSDVSVSTENGTLVDFDLSFERRKRRRSPSPVYNSSSTTSASQADDWSGSVYNRGVKTESLDNSLPGSTSPSFSGWAHVKPEPIIAGDDSGFTSLNSSNVTLYGESSGAGRGRGRSFGNDLDVIKKELPEPQPFISSPSRSTGYAFSGRGGRLPPSSW